MWLLRHAFYTICAKSMAMPSMMLGLRLYSDNSSQPPTTACHSSTSNGPKRVRDALVHYFST